MYVNPYKDIDFADTKSLRANFHIHAGLDGDHKISDVVALYKEAGYDILTISNQFVMSDTKALEQINDIVLFNGFEYVDDKDIVCVDVSNYFTGNRQDVIDQCAAQGGFSILAHPNFMKKGWWPHQEMKDLHGFMGIEIFNGVIFRMEGSGLATDAWDYLLTNGKRVWGFANDDFHRWFDMARGWNIVFSKSKDHKDIKDAFTRGSFYASTGLVLEEFVFDNHSIRVKAVAKGCYVKDYTYRFRGEGGRLLKAVIGDSADYTFTGNEIYVRVEVISEHGAMLWTQPVYKAPNPTSVI